MAVMAVMAVVAVTGAGLGAAGCAKHARSPTPPPPTLDTSSLPAIAQGPGAEWIVTLRPNALLEGALAATVREVVPPAGIDALSRRLSIDVRRTPEAIVVGFASATFYAARLPGGGSPSAAVDALAGRLFDPSGRASPRPDVVRAWGSTAAGGRASIAGLWSTRGDLVIGEGGRLGPVQVAVALAEKRLPEARALDRTPPFPGLLRWIGDAPVALAARCPVRDVWRDERLGPARSPPLILTECEGVAVTLRADGAELDVGVRIAGRWGTDAGAAAGSLESVIEAIAESELGRILGVPRERAHATSAADVIEAHVRLDAARAARGVRKLASAQVAEITAP